MKKSHYASFAHYAAVFAAVDDARAGVPYNQWTVGVTDDLERRWKEHGKPSVWKPFLVGNGIISRAVESALKKKGMSGDTGGPGNATYLYIFITASKTA